MSDDRRLPEDWAAELGLVRAHPREARPVYAPVYRAAQALHYWDLDAYHAADGQRLTLTRAQFDAALQAPGRTGSNGRDCVPVLSALSPHAPPQVRALAESETTPAASGAPVTEES